MNADRTREETIYARTALLSFILTILVVFVHAVNYDKFTEGPEALTVLMPRLQSFCSDVIGQLGAPAFFLVSGFLFYRTFDFSKLLSKWQSRVYSLLIPYLLWNTLYFLAAVLLPRIPFVASMLGRGAEPVTFQKAAEGIALFGNNPVFWFVFQLILLTMLAPVIGLVVKSRIAVVLSLIGLLVSFRYNVILPYFNTDALFYYLIGSWIGAEDHRKSFEKLSRGTATVLRFVMPVLCLILAAGAYRYFLKAPSMLSTILYRALGILFISSFVTMLPAAAPRDFMRYNFFIYALHFPLLRGMNKVAAKFTDRAAMGLVLYFMLPVITVVLIIGIAKGMKKLLPGLYRVLSGGRN